MSSNNRTAINHQNYSSPGRFSLLVPGCVVVVGESNIEGEVILEMRIHSASETTGILLLRHIYHCGPIDSDLMIDWYVKLLQVRGIEPPFSNLIPSLHPEHFKSGWLYYPKCFWKDFPMETVLMSYGTKAGLVQLGLIGPGRPVAEAFYKLNQMAFQAVRDSLCAQDD